MLFIGILNCETKCTYFHVSHKTLGRRCKLCYQRYAMLCLKVELLLGSCFKLGKSVRRPSGDIHLPISWLVTCHCTIKLKSYCLWICMMNIFDAPFLRNINLVSDNHPATDYVFWWSCDYGWEGPVWNIGSHIADIVCCLISNTLTLMDRRWQTCTRASLLQIEGTMSLSREKTTCCCYAMHYVTHTHVHRTELL